MNIENKLPFYLQLFADKGEGESTSGEDGEAEDTNIDTDGKSEDKTFTQEDVNNIASRETKKAQEKIFKELGIEDFKSAKEGFKKFQEWQEAQKTDAEKQSEALESQIKANDSLASENETLKAQLSALKLKVREDAIEDVVTLAKGLVTEDVDMDSAIEQVIEKYPHFAEVEKVDEKEEETTKPIFTTGKHKTDTVDNDPFAKKIAKYKN